jgi:hypothetical protein
MTKCRYCGRDVTEVIWVVDKSIDRGVKGEFYITASCVHCGEDISAMQIGLEMRWGKILIEVSSMRRDVA